MLDNPLALLVRRLRTRASIGEAAEAALLRLPHVLAGHEAGAFVLREGSTNLGTCNLVVSGFAYRQKLTAEGGRQILSLHMRGDLMDLQHLFLGHADHSTQALTRLQTVEIPRPAVQQLVLEQPEIGRAMWIDALIDASIFREWIVNVGQRDARTRIAHLLCEIAVRAKDAGLGELTSMTLPLTQEQIGDATGLTSVHVNRTLRALERDRIISRDKREITFRDWAAVRATGDFNDNYLHRSSATIH